MAPKRDSFLPERFPHEHLTNAIARIVFSLIAVAVGLFLLSQPEDPSTNKLGASLLGTVFGYWIR